MRYRCGRDHLVRNNVSQHSDWPRDHWCPWECALLGSKRDVNLAITFTGLHCSVLACDSSSTRYHSLRRGATCPKRPRGAFSHRTPRAMTCSTPRNIRYQSESSCAALCVFVHVGVGTTTVKLSVPVSTTSGFQLLGIYGNVTSPARPRES